MAAARILVVEDELIVATDIKDKLQRLGYEVTTLAADANEAIAATEKEPPDLVLMDIMLNGKMDGIQTAKIMRERWRLPIVYFTAYADAPTIERARLTEPLGFIHKPLDERELASTISMALHKHAVDRRLQESEARLAATLGGISDAVITTAADGSVEFLNPVAQTLLLVPPQTALQRPLLTCCTISRQKNNTAQGLSWSDIVETSETHASLSVALTTPSGQKQMELRAAALKNADGAVTGYVIVLHDLTERLQAMEALRQSERKYRAMLDAMHDMVYICDAHDRIIYLNPAMLRRLGRDATGEPCYRAIYQRDAVCPWCPRGTTDTSPNIEFETSSPADGRVFRVTCTTIRELDRQLLRMMIIADITERKRAERALQESEARYKRLVASVTDYIYSVKIDPDGRVSSTTHGPGCVAVTGYSTADYEADANLWFKMVHVDDRKKVLEQAQRLLAGEPTPPLEHRIIHKDGRICWVRNTAVVHRDEQGRVTSYDGLITNITERKIAEAQIQEHARRLEIINRIIMAVNKATDLDTMLEEVLASSLELLNFSSGCVYLSNANIAEIRCAHNLPADFMSARHRINPQSDSYRQIFAKGIPRFIENSAVDGDTDLRRWLLASVAQLPLIAREKTIGILLLADQKPHAFSAEEKELLLSIARQLGTALDKISSERALRESENRYRTITEQALVGVQILQHDRLLFTNEGWSEITGYSRAETAHWTIDDFLKIVAPEDRSLFLRLISAQNVVADRQVYDCRFLSKSGAVKWVVLHARPISFADGTATMAIIVDITDRKIAEQALEAANRRLKAREEQLRAINQELFAANEELKARERALLQANSDKEILLKEIHHRVKNNLQVISSLLKLQIVHVADEQARQIIRECQNRIKSIAIVHEKLYQSPNLADVNIADYIQSLIKHLFRTFLVDPAAIRTSIIVDDVALGIDKAIPCSLIINELVSNSLKYAFADTKAGEIFVRLQAEGDHYVLEVADNGRGIPPEIDFRNTATLGMQLVLTFVEQLGGEIQLQRENGTRFRITFAREEKKRPVPA